MCAAVDMAQWLANTAQRLEAYIESDLIKDKKFNFFVRVHASMMANHY